MNDRCNRQFDCGEEVVGLDEGRLNALLCRQLSSPLEGTLGAAPPNALVLRPY
jgi:hypothetical protein